jgi:predicted dehydrogenase
MRFALLGTHPDGLGLACALVESGRHELIAYTSAQDVPEAILRRWGESPRRFHDLEELLADPTIEAVIVAGKPDNRSVQLRRALQSERHVLCVHPAEGTPDIAYEASLLQKDTGMVLFPVLPEALHPGVLRLREMVRSGTRPLVTLRLIKMERWSVEAVLTTTDAAGLRPAFPGWEVLRTIGGEIVEVFALAPQETVDPEQPILLSGRFEPAGLFQMTHVPFQNRPRWRLVAVGSHGRAELTFPQGWGGPAFLFWQGSDGETHEEAWDAWDPWPTVLQRFEDAVTRNPGKTTPEKAPKRSEWENEIRCLELDDAARRSVQKRRSSTLEFQEVSEEVGFKGTMTLVGCGIIWLILGLAIAAYWYPPAGWLIIPLLVVFLGLQFFRWVIPRR